jgi:hypothetical protein
VRPVLRPGPERTGGRVASVPAPAVGQAKLEAAPVYSRWRGGPTSFGPGGRIMLSVGILIGMVVGYPMVRGGMLAAVGFDVPGKGFMLLYTGLAIPAATFLLLRVWRLARIS